MELKRDTRWLYVGHGDFKGLRHTIIDTDDDEITTWSDPLPGEPISGRSPAGFSWLGPKTEFLKNFKPTAK
jgi:hypothetical protein